VKFLERIENLRKVKLLSKAEVYDLVGISQSMISMIRSGDRQPSMKMIRALADAEHTAGIGPPIEAPPAPTPREPMTVREPISNDWKNETENFQRLEKRMADIEQKLDALLEWIQKENK